MSKAKWAGEAVLALDVREFLADFKRAEIDEARAYQPQSLGKCSVGDCARDAVKCFTGTGVRGRPREGVNGVPYCKAHHARMQRGADMAKPIRERLRPGQRRDPYAEAVEDCAAIAEHHGHEGLAALLRGLHR